MDSRRAISSTVKYSGYFEFPLSPEEVHYWLISPRAVSFDSIKDFLPAPMSKREERFRSKVSVSSAEKTKLAKKLVRVLRFVPGLRMVALTGSVAAGNSHPSDDIDLFFVTAPHALWLIRPLVILLISIFFRRRYPGEDHSQATDAFCPNLWLDTLSITVPENKRCLYTAHEVLQVKPLFDRGNTYQSFLFQNRWVKKYLANAYSALSTSKASHPRKSLSLIFSPLNYLFYLFQFLYMYPKKTTETVHLHAAYLHTTDFASKITEHLDHLEDI